VIVIYFLLYFHSSLLEIEPNPVVVAVSA